LPRARRRRATYGADGSSRARACTPRASAGVSKRARASAQERRACPFQKKNGAPFFFVVCDYYRGSLFAFLSLSLSVPPLPSLFLDT
jgi:hypothetical protein